MAPIYLRARATVIICHFSQGHKLLPSRCRASCGLASLGSSAHRRLGVLKHPAQSLVLQESFVKKVMIKPQHREWAAAAFRLEENSAAFLHDRQIDAIILMFT